MNLFSQFLVMLHHSADDMPVRLFDSRQEAVEFARVLDAMPSEQLRKVLGTDCSTPCCVSVVEFTDGEPVASEFVKYFEE